MGEGVKGRLIPAWKIKRSIYRFVCKGRGMLATLEERQKKVIQDLMSKSFDRQVRKEIS